MTYSGDTTIIITSDSGEQAIKNSFDSDYCASHRIPVIIRSKEFEKYLPTATTLTQIFSFRIYTTRIHTS